MSFYKFGVSSQEKGGGGVSWLFFDLLRVESLKYNEGKKYENTLGRPRT
jgi:hypothetical protein